MQAAQKFGGGVASAEARRPTYKITARRPAGKAPSLHMR